MTDTLQKASIKVTATVRGTWHCMNTATLDHWECRTQQEVLNSIDGYNARTAEREAARLQAIEDLKNPQAEEFTSGIPFESYIPTTSAGKPIMPVIDANAPGAAPEPTQVDPSAGRITLTVAEYEALKASQGQGSEPEPSTNEPVGAEPTPVGRGN